MFCKQFAKPNRPQTAGVVFAAPYYWSWPMDYQPEEEAPAPAAQDDSLASQVEGLTNEVRRLEEVEISRAESPPSAPAPQAAAPQAPTEEKPVETLLAYRDGHKTEIENYAIRGNTLWVFSGRTARKIPLAELDLDATRKLNDERGVEFDSADLR